MSSQQALAGRRVEGGIGGRMGIDVAHVVGNVEVEERALEGGHFG
jgi:hypothetical protein